MQHQHHAIYNTIVKLTVKTYYLRREVHPLKSFLWSLCGSFVMNRPIAYQRFWFNNIKVSASTFVFIIKLEPLMSDQTVHNKRTAELSRGCAPTYEVSWSTFCSVSILIVHDIINKLVVLICHHIFDLYFLDPKKLINYDLFIIWAHTALSYHGSHADIIAYIRRALVFLINLTSPYKSHMHKNIIVMTTSYSQCWTILIIHTFHLEMISSFNIEF
jgi:hypothetical protein